MTIKRNSVILYELSIIQAKNVLSLPSGSSVEVALKKTTDPAGTYLYHVVADRAGWGSGSRWFYLLDLSDPAFAAITAPVDFEIILILPDQRIHSDTVSFTVGKNVMP